MNDVFEMRPAHLCDRRTMSAFEATALAFPFETDSFFSSFFLLKRSMLSSHTHTASVSVHACVAVCARYRPTVETFLSGNAVGRTGMHAHARTFLNLEKTDQSKNRF